MPAKETELTVNPMRPFGSIKPTIQTSIAARAELFDEKRQSAFRLFNGFLEGNPDIAIDLYARTVVIHNYADIPAEGEVLVEQAKDFLLNEFNWLQAIIVKTRNGTTAQQKNGVMIYGDKADNRIREHGVWYAVDLTMNRDASLYLDTRNLRQWALENLAGKRVLNTFAYTGSLGVAATAADAKQVIQTDLNKNFLNVAKTSHSLNGFRIHKKDFITGDFWAVTNRLKRAGELFDCVFLDPPFFADTPKGRVDLAQNSAKLINKVRPLVADGGWLAAINNALFVRGAEYLQTLEALCKDGYLSIEALIPVPEDFTGYTQTIVGAPPVDPAPFNHSTKIAVLKVKRKE